LDFFFFFEKKNRRWIPYWAFIANKRVLQQAYETKKVIKGLYINF